MQQIEQPTELGNLCHFLNEMHVHAYTNNDETIWATFSHHTREQRLRDCKDCGSHCAPLMEVFERGDFPVAATDPIILLQSTDRYIASEGKHRVCSAIQLNLERIPAIVRPVKEDWTPLPELGKPGLFSAEIQVNTQQYIRTGQVLWLYLDVGHPFTREPAAICDMLGVLGRSLPEVWTTLAPGVWTRNTITRIRQWWPWPPHDLETFRVEVRITSEIPLGKIWIAALPLVHGWPDRTKRVDIFRRGRFRQHHENQWFGF